MMLNKQNITAILKIFNKSKLNNEEANMRTFKEKFELSDEEVQIIGDNIPYFVINHYSQKKVIF